MKAYLPWLMRVDCLSSYLLSKSNVQLHHQIDVTPKMMEFIAAGIGRLLPGQSTLFTTGWALSSAMTTVFDRLGSGAEGDDWEEVRSRRKTCHSCLLKGNNITTIKGRKKQ